jgi:hypothetical protein
MDSAMLERQLTILEASWHRTPEFGFLMMRLSNGRRVLIPREELPPLKDATEEQVGKLPFFRLSIEGQRKRVYPGAEARFWGGPEMPSLKAWPT